MNVALFSGEWWVAAGKRAAYTGLAAAAPLALLYVSKEVTTAYVMSFVGVAVVLSFLTSIISLPELKPGEAPVLVAVLVRVLRTAAQTALPAFAAVQLFTEINWDQFWTQVVGASLFTLLRAFMSYLPETVPTIPGQVVSTPDGAVKVVTDPPVPTPVEDTGVAIEPAEELPEEGKLEEGLT